MMADENVKMNNIKEENVEKISPEKCDLQTDVKKNGGFSIRLAMLLGMMILLLFILFGGAASLLQGLILPKSSVVIVEESVATERYIIKDIQNDPLTPSAKNINLANNVDDISAKKEKIKEMMLFAWNKYKEFAWGYNELRPISKCGNKRSIFGNTMMGVSIVDALDTLYVMDLKNEFEEGRHWIAENLNVTEWETDLPVYQTNVQLIGGLLSSFAFTGDVMFLNKANDIAQKLLPAFETKSGIPKAVVNARSKFIKNYGWAVGSILAEVGGLHLEFSYLSDVTRNPVFHEKVANVRRILKNNERPEGLYPNSIKPDTGKWSKFETSIGSQGDTFYEYLLKSWVQTGQKDQEGRLMFDDAMKYIIQYIYKVSPSGFPFMGVYRIYAVQPSMDHSACSVGALLGLASKTLKNEMSSLYMEIAENITNTCHETYVRTVTQLGPVVCYFSETYDVKAGKSSEKNYELWPEILESYFLLWRLTKNEKYRRWGWEVAEAIESHCRFPDGYAGIMSVYTEHSMNDDTQHSHFLSATLKYLYLLFSDDSLLSLDEWVFNTEGHPLPIKDQNPLYRAETLGN